MNISCNSSRFNTNFIEVANATSGMSCEVRRKDRIELKPEFEKDQADESTTSQTLVLFDKTTPVKTTQSQNPAGKLSRPNSLNIYENQENPKKTSKHQEVTNKKEAKEL